MQSQNDKIMQTYGHTEPTTPRSQRSASRSSSVTKGGSPAPTRSGGLISKTDLHQLIPPSLQLHHNNHHHNAGGGGGSRPSSSTGHHTGQIQGSGYAPGDVAGKTITEQNQTIAALFIGPKGENFGFMKEYVDQIFKDQQEIRERFSERWDDDAFISTETQNSDAFQATKGRVQEALTWLNTYLGRWNIPFWSQRYAAHMTYEPNIVAQLGWYTAIMYNPNNVAVEGSSISSVIEYHAGQDISKMLGYKVAQDDDDDNTKASSAWGHITSGGTVANLEAMWTARNLKFYPLSLRDAMAPGTGPLNFIAPTFRVHTCTEEDMTVEPKKLFADLTTWELLNLRPEVVLDLPRLLLDNYSISGSYLDSVMKRYSIQTIGKDVLERKWGINKPIQLFAAATMHYSWPKGAALCGIGSENIIPVKLDKQAHIDMGHLQSLLEERFREGQAVYQVVAVMGTTEEGAVDPLDEILNLRKYYQKKGMSFLVHADAAWGGYFTSMLASMPEQYLGRPRQDYSSFVPGLPLPDDTLIRLAAMKDTDSVTIDPHKTGYVPYPAGGLCYKDGRMRYLVTWTTPYISKGTSTNNTATEIGTYGVEGSKPGAAGISVFLSGRVIGLHPLGYGALLGQAIFTRARLSAHWATMSRLDHCPDEKATDYIVVPFKMLPAESAEGSTPEDVEKQKYFIRQHILDKSNEEIFKDSDAMDLLPNLGSDLNVNAFTCNFRVNGIVNDDVEEANFLNKRIAHRLTLQVPAALEQPGENPPIGVKQSEDIPIWITSTEFDDHNYGAASRDFRRRLGLVGDSESLFVLRNVVLSPFSTEGNFVKKLAAAFETVLKEETVTAQKRATEDPVVHSFLLQGSSQIYLSYLSGFHEEDTRRQVILQVTLPEAVRKVYLDLKDTSPGTKFFLRTSKPQLLSEISQGAGSAFMFDLVTFDHTDPLTNSFKVTINSALVDKSLRSRYRSTEYPADFMPFYVYGPSWSEAHVSHILVKAPNTQLMADEIRFDMSNKSRQLTKDLSKGLLLHITNLSEHAMQPMQESPGFWREGASFDVRVWPAGGKGKGVRGFEVKPWAEPPTTGTMTLHGGIFSEQDHLNHDPFPYLNDTTAQHQHAADKLVRQL